jgi:hypothetical protein
MYNNYLHSIYIVLDIISNLEIILSIWKDEYSANPTPFYVRDMRICRFWYSGWWEDPGTNALWIQRYNYTALSPHTGEQSATQRIQLCVPWLHKRWDS